MSWSFNRKGPRKAVAKLLREATFNDGGGQAERARALVLAELEKPGQHGNIVSVDMSGHSDPTANGSLNIKIGEEAVIGMVEEPEPESDFLKEAQRKIQEPAV